MDFDSLKTGRALDAIIAEEVFGCQTANDRDDGLICNCPKALHADGSDDPTVPEYSARMSDAWEIVEALKSKGYLIRLWQNPSRFEIGFAGPNDAAPAYVRSENPATAVCIAALKALASES